VIRGVGNAASHSASAGFSATAAAPVVFAMIFLAFRRTLPAHTRSGPHVSEKMVRLYQRTHARQQQSRKPVLHYFNGPDRQKIPP
jgi:hypothetical protein